MTDEQVELQSKSIPSLKHGRKPPTTIGQGIAGSRTHASKKRQFAEANHSRNG
jgi:hypothetical protein